MLDITDAANFRRTGTGLALIGGPLLVLAANVIAPPHGADERESLVELAAHPGRGEAAAVLLLFALSLIVIGAVGAIQPLKRRGVIAGHLGAVLAVPGLMAFVTLASGLFEVRAVRVLDIDSVAAIEKSTGTAALIYLVFALLTTPIGLTLVLTGLWRGGLAPAWSPVLLLAGFVLTQFPGTVGRVGGPVLILAALGIPGLTMLRLADGAWEPRTAAAEAS